MPRGRPRRNERELEGKKYTPSVDAQFRWESWAAPKGKDGTLDHHKALTGDVWSAPDTRAKLLQGLAEKGFGREQMAEMQRIIDASPYASIRMILSFTNKKTGGAFAPPAHLRSRRII